MTTNAEYNKWMNQKFSRVQISVSPSQAEYDAINREYLETTGSDNYYDFPEKHDEIRKRYNRIVVLNNVSLTEAQAFAEPIRIANPDQCVNISTEGNSFIGNTSWNDQLEMFFEYPTYTEIGKQIMAKRKAEANAMGINASWE